MFPRNAVEFVIMENTKLGHYDDYIISQTKVMAETIIKESELK